MPFHRRFLKNHADKELSSFSEKLPCHSTGNFCNDMFLNVLFKIQFG
ncbi:hypothetical protein EJP617_28070 [Erwinia sp. Ejp617]|nr:hypothetical protein EJP617_28070 [Erwinia sp. Ejp617]